MIKTRTDTGVKVLLCRKGFAMASHSGLGISGLQTAKVLSANGVPANVATVNLATEIAALLKADPRVTHCVIAAPWLKTADIQNSLLRPFADVQFAVATHSNLGFLSADRQAMTLIREYINLEESSMNFEIAANCKKATLWLRSAYQAPCAYLGNMYWLSYAVNTSRPVWRGGTLNIAAFGAQRPLKNLMTAAGAALEIKNELKAQVDVYINSGRLDGGNLGPLQEMLAGIPGITLKQVPWTNWNNFRDIVREMHLMISPSFTESFCMVVADGIAEGVPSAVSTAIDWVPDYWQCDSDVPRDIARVGRQLISDPYCVYDGFVALEQHNADAFAAWCKWLGIAAPAYKSLVPDPFLL